MSNKFTNSLILNFIYKYLCILKAASEGCIIKYIGGNKFEFISNKKLNINKLLHKYTQTLPSMIITKS
jgi:hypothetical protein